MRETIQEKWIKSISQLMILDYIDSFCKRWPAEDVSKLRKVFNGMVVKMADTKTLQGCDAFVLLDNPKRVQAFYSKKPSCPWFQLIAHEVAHVLDFVHSGDGTTHSADFFRMFNRLLSLWTRASNSTIFVATEHITCTKKGQDELEEGQEGPS